MSKKIIRVSDATFRAIVHAQGWLCSDEQEYTAVPVVLMEDPIIHTDEHPYCDDRLCPCHDEEMEVPFTDEEIEQIMASRSPLDVDIEENYHRSFFDGLSEADLEDHPF